MTHAYQITSTGLLGNVIELADKKPAPAGYTFTPPPTNAPVGSDFRWVGGRIGWQIVDVGEAARLHEKAQLMALNEAKANKLSALHDAWLAAEANGIVQSSVGFAIDATERANRDIEGLIISMEAGGIASTTFCDAANFFHEVSLDQLKIMRLEVIAHGQQLYARKWQLRMAIENAQAIDDLEAIAIDFESTHAKDAVEETV